MRRKEKKIGRKKLSEDKKSAEERKKGHNKRTRVESEGKKEK